jgi:hypothetical protein
MNLYEMLKARKVGWSNDFLTNIYAKAFGGSQPASEHEYTGTVPHTFKANGEALIDWYIKGNTGGVGDRTGNLFSSVWEQGTINANGQTEPSNIRIRTADYIEVKPNTIYSMSRNINVDFMNVRFYKSDKSFVGTGSASTIRLISGYSEANPMYNEKFCCFEIIDNTIKYMRCADQSNNLSTKYMMVEGEYTEQTMPAYEPYGYKIPVICGGETNTFYLDEPLGASDSITMTSTGVSIPTVNGSNTLSVGTTVQPSEVYIKWKG